MYLVPGCLQILSAKLALRVDLRAGARRILAGITVEPSNRRVVVMRSRVGYDILVIIVRQIRGCRIAAEGKLQHAHSRKTKVVAQPPDVLSYDAQIFGDDWQFVQRRSDGGEQFPSRHFDPLAAFGGPVTSGDLPTCCEAAKVIDTHDVYLLQCRAHAIDPPTESVRLHLLPA